MTVEYASLVFKADTRELDTADRKLGKVDKSAKTLTGSIVGLAAKVGLAAAAMATLRKTVSVAREFDILNAQLVTATGSAEGAAQAFEAIQDFATLTPFALGEVTEAFVQLKNMGLDPSEAALTSYGNTAAALGRNIGDIVGIVSRSITGEFESLKTLGIIAKRVGDDVALTFRGITTTVGFNAAEIEEYMKALGDNEFAGAMAQRVETLDGALSNLGDEWDKLFLNISNNGVGSVLEDSVRGAISALEELNAQISSGELIAKFENFADSWSEWGDAADSGITYVSDLFAIFAEDMGLSSTGMVDFLIDSFNRYPANVMAMVKIIGIELEHLGQQSVAAIDKQIESAQKRLDLLRPESRAADEQRLRLASLQADREVAAVQDQIRIDSIAQILAQRDAEVLRIEEGIAGAKELRRLYDEETAARAAAGGDRLAEFQFDAGEQTSIADQAAADALVKSLLSEEEAIIASHEFRMSEILRLELAGALSGDQAREQERRAIEKHNAAIIDLNAGKYDILLSAADRYFDGMEGEEAAYARAAISIGQSLLTEKGRQQLTDLWNSTYSGAMSAYAALAGIPFIGPALGAAAFATVMGTGAMAASNMLSGREEGGQVLAGTSYIVGERGPEILNMGSSAGNVSQIGSRGDILEQNVEINISVQALDGADAMRVIEGQMPMIAGRLNQMAREKGREGIL